MKKRTLVVFNNNDSVDLGEHVFSVRPASLGPALLDAGKVHEVGRPMHLNNDQNYVQLIE